VAGVLVQTLLLVLALPALAASGYLLALTVLSARLPPPPRSTRTLRFDVIVPAHNEASVIGRSLQSLSVLDWPAENFRRIVVADNCSDDTARIARAAGATVIERNDPALPGKGHALALAFAFSRASGLADAVVVVDADAEVSPNLLEALATRIEAGAGVVQAHYGVLRAGQSWRTRLIAIAYGAVHTLRSRARERLRLSCGLRGNGWCVTHAVLEAVPYRAFSQTEDLEYGIVLGLAGQRVHFAGEASADAEMADVETVARRQRQRWEDGRFALIRSQTLPLLRAALRQRSAVCLDLALDLLVLPLSYVALNVLALVAATALAALWRPALLGWLWAGGLAAAALLIYVLRGWQLSGRGAAGLLDLLYAPVFIAWKMLWVLRRHPRHAWAPTRRQEP
jgi:cellulose synthase/poly-beta-1,6-N-acetylglucosamine synthase-like glycosyltransferase